MCLHGVLRVLVRQEMGELDDGGVDAAADVPPGGRVLLGDEHLRTAQVSGVNQRHAARGHLDSSQHPERCFVACKFRSVNHEHDS